jgi:hypothetical protein
MKQEQHYPQPMPMQAPSPRRHGGPSFSPRAFLVAVLIAAILVILTQVPFGEPPGEYQRASVGHVLPKGEAGFPANFTITVTNVSGLVSVLDVHQYTTTDEGMLVAQLAGNGAEYRASDLYNTWEIQVK